MISIKNINGGNQMICIICKNEENFEIRNETETYTVKGESISIEAKVTYCKTCNLPVWNEISDSENIQTAYTLYRKKFNLLQPDEIQKIRELYDLSQVSFSRILGLGDKTITRYENGSIQDNAINNLILLMRNVENFESLLNKNEKNVTPFDYKKIKNAVAKLTTQNFYQTGIISYNLNNSNNNIWSGMNYA